VRPPSPARPLSDDLSRRLDRLDGLPLRPASARWLLSRPADSPARLAEIDPGWALAEAIAGGPVDPLALVAARPWWPRPSAVAAGSLDRLWRHAVAAARAARRLAVEAADPGIDPDRVARVALLHPLGYWAVGAVDPDALAELLAEPDPAARRDLERRRLGTDAATLGRDLAERWGADPAVVDAAWLLGDGDLGTRLAPCAEVPALLPLARKARAWADRTPWSPAAGPRPAPGPPDPRLRLLMAEVEVRCGPGLVAADANEHEERLARAHARLLAGSAAAARERDALAAARDRSARRLDVTAAALQDQADRDGRALDAAKLDALAEFAAGAGHELNNPLAVILGRAQLLLARRPAPDPEAARSLRAIAGQAQRAHRIIRDLMAVARPPAPRPRPCLPDEVVRSCLRDLRDEAEARGVRLIGETRDPGPRAWIDPDPLRHLADVLVRNAIEATPPGGTVRFTAAGDPGCLRWAVQDDGRGLDPAEAAHLFDPFFCGRQAGRGLGLGLPRAARFAARSGGELRWDPTPAPGRGTIFRLHLPLEPPPPAPGPS